MLNAIKCWKSGAHRLSEKQIEKLKTVKPKGRLVEAIPSFEDKPSLKSIPNFIVPLHSYKKHACFEIWLHQNRLSFYIFAREEKLLDGIKAQLSVPYPIAFFKDAESTLIPLKAGTYVCSATLRLDYCYCEINCIENFASLAFGIAPIIDYDPLSHIIESLDIDAMLQIASKAKKISNASIEKLKSKLDPEAPYTKEILRKLSLPCFRVLISFVAFSENFEEPRRSVETLANAFSSFNGKYARFKPRITSFPILTNSFSILKASLRESFH